MIESEVKMIQDVWFHISFNEMVPPPDVYTSLIQLKLAGRLCLEEFYWDKVF